VWAYFDASALVKRYVEEPGRREVQQLLRGHECVTSAILPVELQSALRRRVAERTLDSSRLSEILKRVAADRAYWTVVEVGSEVLNGAEALVSVHPLRTLDAIHVASAQLFASRLSIADLMFVRADKRQIDAASAIGLATRVIPSPR
jgi:predicted nucleic acid-binding protein